MEANKKNFDFESICMWVAAAGLIIFLLVPIVNVFGKLSASGYDFLALLFEQDKIFKGLFYTLVFLAPFLRELRVFLTQKDVLKIPQEKVVVINKYDRPVLAILSLIIFFTIIFEEGIKLEFGGVLYLIIAIVYVILSINNLKEGLIENKINELFNKKK